MICVEVDEEVFYKNIGIFLKSSDDQQKQPPRSEPQGNKPTTQKVVVTTRPDVQNGKNQKRTPVSNHMTTRKPYGVKDFTLYPVWPDEEEYHRDPVVENWNCPVNLRKSEVSWFKEAFIPNVGFFMHKEHFNEKEWRRLEKFNPPYGWMGADYKDVKEAVEVMPSLTEQKLLLTPTSKDGCIRCAAVGNGGILNGSRKGQEIDSHDYVFRVNGAIIKGFETDVGSKTSFYVHTAHTMTASLYVYKKDGFTKVPVDKDTKFILLPEGRRDYEWMKALYQNTTVSKGYFHRKRPATYFGDHFTMDKYFVIHPDFSRYLKNRNTKSAAVKTAVKKRMVCIEVDEEVFLKNIGLFLQTPEELANQTSKTQDMAAKAGLDIQQSQLQGNTSQSNQTTTRKPYNPKDFSQYPVWPDEDEYHRDPMEERKTCPVSLRKSNVDWFKKAFIPDVGIFMHKEHFSEPEWKRLEKFNPPYGWMGTNYQDVKDAVESMPSLAKQKILLTTKSRDGCIRCAVVGNGGILNGSRKGQEIDSHDYVFRIGQTSPSSFADFLISSTQDTKYILLPEGGRDYEWMKALYRNTTVEKGRFRRRWPVKYFGENFTMDKYLVIHPDFSRYIMNRYMKSKALSRRQWDIYRPTTGAFSLMTALHLCDVVNAYGYITEDYKKYSDHYFDTKYKKTVFYINHDFSLEMKTWRMFHDAKLFNLYHKS
ncbi:SIA7A sialyltransferase, partial [Polypterus senegalus]